MARWTANSSVRALRPLVILWAVSAGPWAIAATGNDEAERSYFSANGFLNRGLNDLAVEEYRKFLAAQPQHAKADVARYGLAVGLYRLGRMDESRSELERLYELETFTFAPETALMLGRCRFEKEQFEPAAKAFLRVVNQFPDHVLVGDAMAGAAEALQRSDQHAEAVELCQRLIRSRPDYPHAERVRFVWGVSALALKNYAAAGERFSEVAAHRESPLAAQASLLQARCAYHQDQFDAALRVLKGCESGDESLQDDAAYWAGKCLLKLGKFEQAAERLRPALARFPKSELRAAMALDLGFAELQGGNAGRAGEQLQKFLSEYPSDPSAADALHLLALAEHQRKNFDASSGHCRRFLEQYPNHESAIATLFLAAENDYLSERWAAAIEGYQRYLSRCGDVPQAFRAKLRLGTALIQASRDEEAVAPLRAAAKASGADPSLQGSWLLLGDLYFRRGEWKASAECFSQYTSLGKDLPSLDDAWLKLGLALQREGRLDEALVAFDRLQKDFEASPHRPQAQFEKAQVLIAAGRAADAEKLFALLVKDPAAARFAPYAENHLGVMALQKGSFAQACKHFERAKEGAGGTPLEPEVVLNLGKAQLSQNLYADAERTLADYASRFADQPERAEAQGHLAWATARLDRCDKALEIIRTLERDFATMPSLLVEGLQYEKALCLRKLDRPEADAAFQSLAFIGASIGVQAHSLLELADSLMAAQRFDEAAEHLRRLKELTDQTSNNLPGELREQALYRFAACEYSRGRHKESVGLFEEFLPAFPQSPMTASALLLCGEGCLKLNRFDRAAEHLQRMVDAFPGDPNRPTALLRLGESLAALQRWTGSEAAFSAYLSSAGDRALDYQARFGVGWARENLKRFDEAVQAYREVIAGHQGPTAARAQFQIGECLFAQGKLQEAVAELLKVDILYAHAEWSAAALFEAGRCFEKMAKPDDAQAQYRAVVERFGGTRWADLAGQRRTDGAGHAQVTK